MSDPTKPTPTGPAPGTHCTWCGAEYTRAAQPTGEPPAAPRPPGPAGAEPATHCEWCGAEYPLPDAES